VEAEAKIAAELPKLMIGSRVIGEEAASLDPGMLEHLEEGLVWLVDPLDGTANFAAGRSPFSLMVALLSAGDVIAAWMLDPLSGKMAIAERGGGAWVDGERVTTRCGSRGAAALRGAVFTGFMPAAVAEPILSRCHMIGETLPGLMCCGAEYPAVALGMEDFALFWDTRPWDHAPGALFLLEAGGHVARPDGRDYRVSSGRGGLLAARCIDVWVDVQRALLS
jgi:fructose-1,6-bisphosphatase/inositol monophosphatase family enzyme